MTAEEQMRSLLASAGRHERRARSERERRDRDVMAARALGASYGQIAAALGLTKPGAQSLVRRGASALSESED